jgi:CubicO group peptidase (beta-lactamase class C family)
MKLFFLLSFFPLLSFSQADDLPYAPDRIYPDSAWQMIQDPGAEGWNTLKLRLLKQFIIDSTNATGVVIIQHGEELFHYGNIRELSYVAGCRQSILSMLYGPFVKAGKINLNTTIGQLGIDDTGGLLDIEKKATIQDIISGRSGVYHQASNKGDGSFLAPVRGTVQPGTMWLDNNWDFNVAGYILEQQTGMNIYDLVDSMFARPLQMQDWDRNAQKKEGDSSKSKYLAYHMWLSTRDMARIGYLMLCNGKWKNQQLIPPDWVKISTSVITSHKEAVQSKTAVNHFAFGYMWRVWDEPYDKGIYEGAYTATGQFGQFITVIPKLDMVIALKTNSLYGRETSLAHYLKLLDKLVAARK